jgi:hypothetical protein
MDHSTNPKRERRGDRAPCESAVNASPVQNRDKHPGAGPNAAGWRERRCRKHTTREAEPTFARARGDLYGEFIKPARSRARKRQELAILQTGPTDAKRRWMTSSASRLRVVTEHRPGGKWPPTFLSPPPRGVTARHSVHRPQRGQVASGGSAAPGTKSAPSQSNLRAPDRGAGGSNRTDDFVRTGNARVPSPGACRRAAGAGRN